MLLRSILLPRNHQWSPPHRHFRYLSDVLGHCGYGLEVPCKYRISGQEKAVDWIKRKAITFLQEHSLAVNKCLGKKYKQEKLFMCPLYGGRLWFKCSCGT